MNFYAYVIYSDEKKIYIGHTNDLENRLARHNNHLPNKKSSFTHKQGKNWRLIHTERFTTRAEAQKREKQLKSSRGRNFIKQILEKSNL